MNDGELKFEIGEDEPEAEQPAVLLPDDMRARLNERQDMTEALTQRLQQTLAAPRWAVFMMRWEDGKLPMEHVVYNWSDSDYPAIVNDVRKRVQQIQQENLARRRADGKEPLRGHVRSRTLRRDPEA